MRLSAAERIYSALSEHSLMSQVGSTPNEPNKLTLTIPMPTPVTDTLINRTYGVEEGTKSRPKETSPAVIDVIEHHFLALS